MITLISGVLSIIFALFSVCNSHRPHYALVYLIATFISTSLLLILSGVVFVGVSYLIVYVGAILVLFLFVVLLMDVSVNNNALNNDFLSIRIISIAIITLFIGTLLSLYGFPFITISNNLLLNTISADTSVAFLNQIQSLATMLYAGSGAPIIPIIALILMIAMLATLLHAKNK